MKKFLKSLVLFAAAAMALTSCENEGLNEGIEANDTYTLTFTAGAPESKTSVDITTGSYAWGDNEVVTFLQYANESVNKVISNSYEKDVDGKATFGATFNTIDDATTYNHIAIYPSTNYVSENVSDDFSKDKIRVQVPQGQTLTDGNFDPKADLMISRIITTEGAVSEALSMEFSRLAAVGVMNLKGVRDGEKISKVTFTIGDNSTKLTGRHTFKFSDGSLYENAYHGYNSVILTATEGNELTAVEAGTPIYFTCLDGKFFGAYSVEVETNLATYTTAADKTLAEDKALVFSAGDVLKFTLNATERVDKDFSIDYSGTYQILTKRTTGNYFYATSDLGTAGTKRYQAVDAGSADINLVSTTNENTVWTIEKVADSDKYYVKAGEQYAYWTTGNSANFTEDIESAIKFTIDANEDGTYNIHWTASDAERYFALNGTSGSDYFAFYKSGQKQDLQLIPYVVETKTLQSIAVSGQTTEYEVEGTFNFDGTVTATYTGDTTGKTYTKTITEGYIVSTPDLSQVAESVEVTVTYEGKTATYNITVKEKQQGAAYVKVTEAPADWSGTYLIVYETNNVAFNGGLAKGSIDVAYNTIDVTISNNAIVSNATTDAATFTIATTSNGYSIQAKSGLYIGGVSGSNDIKESDTAVDNTINWTNSAPVITSNSKQLVFNSASNQLRFRYMSSGGAIALYKYTTGGEEPETPVVKQDQTLSFSAATANATVGEDFTEPTLNGAQTTVEYTSSNTAVATVDANTGAVTLVGAGETTITATAAANDNYNEGTAFYTLTVSAAQGGGEGGEGDVVLSEEFDNTNTTLDGAQISSSTFPNFSGTCEKAYKGCGGIKLGTSSAIGFITSKALDLSSAFTVKLDAGRYKSKATEITVTVGNQTKTILNTQLKDGTDTSFNYTTFELEFEAASANATVVISTTSNGKRAGIDNVIITKN